jgi:hypothetical protein
MSLARSLVVTALTLVLAASLLVLVFLALTAPEPSTLFPTLIPPPALEPPPEPAGEAPPPPAPRRALAIEGKVFDPHLQPCLEGTVRLGAELAAVGPDGSFSFPPLVRPRFELLSVTVEGREAVLFPEVLSGDAGGSGESGDDLEPAGWGRLLPARPERLRWTLNLLPDAPASVEEFSITPSAVLVEDWGAGGRLQARGRSTLPEGAHIYSTLTFSGVRLASAFEPAELEDGGWLGAVVIPADVKLYSGTYELLLSHNALLEPFDLLEKWREELPEGSLEELSEIIVRRAIFLGVQDEARREDRAAAAYFCPLLEDVRALHAGLEKRVEEVLAMGKGWDPAFLRAREEAHAAWFRSGFFDAEGRFEEARWRRYLDGQYRPRLARLLEAHRSRSQRKYLETEVCLENLLSTLLTLSRVYSRLFVYPLFQLPEHPADYHIDEAGQEDLVLLRKVIEEGLAQLERFCSELAAVEAGEEGR